jgi:predicted lipoprotein with Yx(FWY)xxD motif
MKALLVTTAAAVLAALVLVPAAMAEPSAAAGVSVRDSRFGPILFDHRGFVLYGFTRDRRNRTTCFGPCAAAWPVFYTRAKPRALAGARASLIGTIKRGNRLQVTYAGRPLYYYVGDRSPGQITCQNIFEYGGLWLVVRANGTFVR